MVADPSVFWEVSPLPLLGYVEGGGRRFGEVGGKFIISRLCSLFPQPAMADETAVLFKPS